MYGNIKFDVLINRLDTNHQTTTSAGEIKSTDFYSQEQTKFNMMIGFVDSEWKSASTGSTGPFDITVHKLNWSFKDDGSLDTDETPL